MWRVIVAGQWSKCGVSQKTVVQTLRGRRTAKIIAGTKTELLEDIWGRQNKQSEHDRGDRGLERDTLKGWSTGHLQKVDGKKSLNDIYRLQLHNMTKETKMMKATVEKKNKRGEESAYDNPGYYQSKDQITKVYITNSMVIY